jgi:hypothetical protein
VSVLAGEVPNYYLEHAQIHPSNEEYFFYLFWLVRYLAWVLERVQVSLTYRKNHQYSGLDDRENWRYFCLVVGAAW